MSRRADVFDHGERVGMLEHLDDGSFRFTYLPEYLSQTDARAVSMTLPLRDEPYTADHLFPFFYGLLAEGSTRDLQANLLKIDRDDHFGLLVATGRDLVGSVTVRPEVVE